MFKISSDNNGITVKWNKQILTRYNFQIDGYRPYWHPIRLPDSPVLTMNQPHDHVHHQGMWIAWKSVNGVNFWEQPKPNANPEGYGKIIHKELFECSSDSHSAQFITKNEWVDWKRTTHLVEERQTKIYTPESKYMLMDIKIQLKPVDNDVILDVKRGKPGGMGLFYSGLTIRFHNNLTPGKMLNSQDINETSEIYGSKSSWCDFAGKNQEDNQVYGITITDHPDNPRYPTPWWVRNTENYALLQPCLCYNQPYKIPSNEKLILKYRIIIHREYVNKELINNLSF
ncbi:hypothetical protein GF312_11335 [Candidatus Poribacteria bacterium]|nr:hypothetical protein [Candidatus Poribacteria bacterium]